MTFQEAASHFLARLTPEGKRRATRVLETAEVNSLVSAATRLEGRVRHGIGDYQVKLDLGPEGLTHQVRPGMKHAESIAAVLLIKEFPELETALVAGGGSDADDAAGLLQRLVEDLGRPLESDEKSYWTQLLRRWEQFRQSGVIHDFDMVRFHPRWVGVSAEPLDLWPSPPLTLGDFWNLISWHLRRRRLKAPAFMSAITDPAAADAVMVEWERKRELETWRRRLETATSRSGKPHRIELRMVVTPQDLRLQYREGDSGEWEQVEDESLPVWSAQWDEGALTLDTRSWIVWQFWKQASDPLHTLECRLDLTREETGAEFGRFWLAFRGEGIFHSLVTLEEQPLTEGPRLAWICEPAGEEGDEFYQIRLVDETGERAAAPLRPLKTLPALYLGYERIFEGPPCCLPGETATSHRIPAEALESEIGVAFLQRLGAALPERIEEMKRDTPLFPRIVGKLLRQDSGGPEQVVLAVSATSEDGRRVEHLTAAGWVITRNEETPGEIRSYQRELADQAAEHVRELPVVYDEYQQGFRCRVSKVFAERFFTWAETLPQGCGLELEDLRLKSILAEPVKASVKFDIEEGAADWFDLKVRLDVAHLNLTEKELRELIQARGRHVRLGDGSWMRLRIDVDPEFEESAAALGLDLYEAKPTTHRYHLMQLIGNEIITDGRLDLRERLRERLDAQRAGIKETPPTDLRAELRPYQRDGFDFLTSLSKASLGGILADDMGLGKTVQSLAWLLWLRKRHDGAVRPPPALVICPKTVLDVWQSEAARFCPDLHTTTVRTLPPNYKELERSDLVVMNYAALRREIDKLARMPWLAVILDEGQHIKNPDSQSALAARALKSSNRVVLTGTPVENRMLDLWSLMQFAVPGALGERSWFVKRFDRRRDSAASDQMAARIRPFLLRRTKEQVLTELPPRTEEDLLCPMTRVQRKMYRDEIHQIQNRLLATLGRPGFQTQIAVLQGLTRLRQIACDPRLVNRQLTEEHSAKLSALIDHGSEVLGSGHKILVFSQFVSMLDLIEERLKKEGVRTWKLTGKTRDRREVVDSFQNHDGPGMFLLSLKAGGTGLNLTSASYVFLYDPWWNPAAERQAVDRTHRIGQNNPVFAYRLIARNTVEQKIRLLQEKKRRLSESVLGAADFTRDLSEEDIRYLFSYDEDV